MLYGYSVHTRLKALTSQSCGSSFSVTFCAKIRTKIAIKLSPQIGALDGQNKLGQVALFLKELFLFKAFCLVAPQRIFQVAIVSRSVQFNTWRCLWVFFKASSHVSS